MGPQFRAYAHWVVSTQRFLSATRAAIAALASLTARRLMPRLYKWWMLPARVRVLRAQVISKHGPPALPALGPVPERLELILCGQVLSFDGEATWARDFPDPEIRYSLHRWGWLLRDLTRDKPRIGRDEGVALMRSWVRSCSHLRLHRSDAYSAAERIVNGTIFLLRTGDGRIPADLVAAFHRMGKEVARNLEYHGALRTGNHVFNNARGMLFAALLAGDPDLGRLAVIILERQVTRLVTSEGFLREASSHYQFLFTRWSLEVVWVAGHFGRADLAAPVSRWLPSLLRACWFLVVPGPTFARWSIPLVGDISPDAPPSWLLPLLWSKLALEFYRPPSLPPLHASDHWSSLWGYESGDDELTLETKANPASGWYRLVSGRLVLFIFAHTGYDRRSSNHGHEDLGSFVLFFGGEELVTDSGRLNYTGDAASGYGRAAEAHNTVCVDGLGPLPQVRSWMVSEYVNPDIRVEVSAQGSRHTLQLRHAGFAGLGVTHTRIFTLQTQGLHITDSFQCTRDHRVAMRVHLPQGFHAQGVASTILQLGTTGASLEFDSRLSLQVYSGVGEKPLGIQAREYGVAQRGTVAELTSRLGAPGGHYYTGIVAPSAEESPV